MILDQVLMNPYALQALLDLRQDLLSEGLAFAARPAGGASPVALSGGTEPDRRPTSEPVGAFGRFWAAPGQRTCPQSPIHPQKVGNRAVGMFGLYEV